MGLVNASFTLQKMMQLVLSGLQWQNSKLFEKHLENLRLIFDQLKGEGLKLKPRKCRFCRTEVPYLSHIVGKDGIKPNPDKITVGQKHPVPRDCSEIRSFVAFVSYYHRFIKNFASVSPPLRPRLHGIGSKTIRIDMGTDRHCVYTGPGVSVYFWICYPNTFGFAFKSGYVWIRTLFDPV